MDVNDPIFEWMQSPENPKLLILMRGCPSSGKTYQAEELANKHNCKDRVFSADHFFGLTKEEYVANWDREKLFSAHRQCQLKCRIAMQKQLSPIIIDNTNIRIAEMLIYFDMAVQYQYKVEIEEAKSPWWTSEVIPYLCDKETNAKLLDKGAYLLWQKNQETHCVPLASIRKMIERYQPNVTFGDLVRCYAR